MENKNKILLVGALIGALTGMAGAMMLIRRAEDSEDGEAHITTSDGMKLGVMVFGLLRAIGSLGDEK